MKYFDPREKRLHVMVNPRKFALRTLSLDFVSRCLEEAGLHIVDALSWEESRAYILSESSLFIGPGSLVSITCGASDPCALLRSFLQPIPIAAVSCVQVEYRSFPPSDHFSAVARPGLADIAELADFHFKGQSINQVLSLDTAVSRSSGVEHSFHSMRLLMDRPSIPADCDMLNQALCNFFKRLFGTFHSHSYNFEPQGFSANFVAMNGFACAHMSPGDRSYASLEYMTALSSDADPDFNELLDMLKPREAWLVSEKMGSLSSSKL